MFLPLPKGEGRGEGEGNVPKQMLYPFFYTSFIPVLEFMIDSEASA